MVQAGGQLMFTRGIYSVPFHTVFTVKVGAVSGADELFTNDELGTRDFVCSHTAKTGETRRMIYLDQEGPIDFLLPHKERLLARRVTDFDESNWWKWGRRQYLSEAPRIYVNHKTRNPQPFFLHPCLFYDGSVLGLFPKRTDLGEKQLRDLTAALNEVDWSEQGFVCDGRFLFSQRSLEHTLLPEFFTEFAPR
jgi:adenine-specific DNA-methyltransferase